MFHMSGVRCHVSHVRCPVRYKNPKIISQYDSSNLVAPCSTDTFYLCLPNQSPPPSAPLHLLPPHQHQSWQATVIAVLQGNEVRNCPLPKTVSWTPGVLPLLNPTLMYGSLCVFLFFFICV